MFTELKERIQMARREINEKILSLPQNPDIEALSPGSRAFTVKASDLSGNPWSPGYHDFTSQYQMIVKTLDETPIEQVEKKLREMIKKGHIPLYKIKYPLHPGVVKNLQSLFSNQL